MKAKGQSWESDLAAAHKLEDDFAETLSTEFQASVTQAPKDSSFTQWDIKGLWETGDEYTFELKFDRNYAVYGNIALEVGRTMQDGTYKETGITASTADIWVYYIPQYNQFYMIHSCELKEMMKKCHMTKGGDGNRAHIYLIPKALFLSKAVNLKTFLD